MGLFSLFKSSPSASTSTASSSLRNTQNDSNNQSTSSNGSTRPTTPNPDTHLSLGDSKLQTPSRSRLVRPSIPPPSPSNSSIASKLRWKKGKGKEKDQGQVQVQNPVQSHFPSPDTQDPIAGLPYEQTSSFHIPQTRTTSLPNSPQSTKRKPPNEDSRQRRRSTLLVFDDPISKSPLSNSIALPVAESSAVTHVSGPIEGHDQGEQECMIDQHDTTSTMSRKDRIASGQFRQIGGILGQWDFEVDDGSKNSSTTEKWLKRHLDGPSVPTSNIKEPSLLLPNDLNANDPILPHKQQGLAPSITDESIVLVHKDDIPLDPEGDVSQISLTQGRVDNHEHHHEDNKVEILESAEKKNKFWKRPRRSSKSYVDEVERSDSPTPRKDTRNTTSLDLPADRLPVDIDQPIPRQPRPTQLRRPSSSFFHNPFNRSASRTSLAIDYENSRSADDGSFQLKGFRHVSGMMEIEGAGELENYLTHVRKDPRSSISSADLLTSPVIGNNEFPSPSSRTQNVIPSPPVSYALDQPPPIPISRPASIAHSIGSATGEDFITANKVSVAAFRRGIRRPSENLVTKSDIGHGSTTPRLTSGQYSPLHDAASDEDDDDVPLGMIKGKDIRREKSSQSLYSMTEFSTTRSSASNMIMMDSKRPAMMFDQIDRKASPSVPDGQSSSARQQNQPDLKVDGKSPALSPGQEMIRRASPKPELSFDVNRKKLGHQRNGGGSGGSAFVVKSARSTRDDIRLKDTSGQNTHRQLGNPAVSGASTPIPLPELSGQDITTSLVTSPEESEPIDGYFSHLAPFINDQPAQSSHPSRVGTPKANNSRQSQSPSPSKAPGPPIAPLPLPQPGVPSPESLNLPLPPDQMPDTPPKNPSVVPNVDANSSLSPNARKKLSLLEEPMKIISGLWHSPPTNDDAFDPDFVLSSMDALGGDHESDKPTKQNGEVIAKGSDTPDLVERVRSPLAERLAGIASSSGMKSPTVPEAGAGVGILQDQGHPHIALPKEEFTSSFARIKARKTSKHDSTESEDESDSESTSAAESSGLTSQSKVRASPRVGAMPAATAKTRKVDSPPTFTGERQVPLGPRKPSTGSNRKRTSSLYTSPGSSMTMNNIHDNVKNDDDRSLGSKLGKSPSVSNLSTLATTTSLSSDLARRDMPIGGSRPKTLIELGPVVQPLKDLSNDHSTSPTSMTSFRPQLKSRAQSRDRSRPEPPRQQTSSRQMQPISQVYQRHQQSPPSRNIVEERQKSPPSTQRPIKRSPAQTLIKLPDSETTRKTASPDSSRSTTTGGTGASVNYQPMTPKESEVRILQGDQTLPVKTTKGAVDENRKQISSYEVSENVKPQSSRTEDPNRQRSYSSMSHNHSNVQPQNPWNIPPNMGYNQNQMMNMGMMPQLGMDPEAMRNMMKQHWQMQFMAAALRASEEQWERQSGVSGQTNHTLPATYAQASQMPNMGWGMGMMGQYHNPMGMYGHPQGFQGQGQMMFPNQFYGHPMVPSSPSAGSTLGLGTNSDRGGVGMYSYGTNMGAQSVFGGEFGPPPITPSQKYMGSQQPSIPTNLQSQNISSPRGRNGRDSSSFSQSVYIPSNLSTGAGSGQNSPPPPSSWGRRSAYGSGDWSNVNESQNQSYKNVRPQTQIIN
ncbi:uncharacterized protein I206_105548 [Kwoniella pini CBS 10737]|uniref:Uncharacterized protein n=1 Tax=Kwoniella pini CBS 10737 TaxID=1296096 RepID=A0A1B9I3Y7_9TREE|nr:uncharacterized protein I206_03549 [Kwoniella pini CBS 10737]OCF50230.1 hypothetical protein I206_03549 [Kwoniella pini CBS 10737]